MNVQKQDKKIWVELNKDEWKEFKQLVEKTDSIIFGMQNETQNRTRIPMI